MKIGTGAMASRGAWITVVLLSAVAGCSSGESAAEPMDRDATTDATDAARPEGGPGDAGSDTSSDGRDAPGTNDANGAETSTDRNGSDANDAGSDAATDAGIDVPVTAPAAFTLTGISGPADNTPDSWLVGTPTPTVTWQASAGAAGYEVVVYEEDGLTVKCPAKQVDGTATSTSFATCTLTEGLQYRASVAATAGTFRTAATNDKFRFAVGAVVFGQPDAKSNEGLRLGLALPNDVVFSGSKVIVADQNNSRVLIWNAVPTANQQPADMVLGQPDLMTSSPNYAGISAKTFNGSNSVSSDGTKLVVGDRFNHRVLIWNTFPTKNNQPADVVLGQPDFVTGTSNTGGAITSQTLTEPWAWICGTKLVVSDRNNARVLIWNAIPTQNQKAADVVLGQPNMVSGTANNGGLDSSSVADPGRGWCDGTKLYLPDLANHRVLIWNTIPTANDTAADLVLGQSSMNLNSANAGGAVSLAGLNSPIAVYASGNTIAVADYLNHRVSVWTTPIASNGQSADLVLGQSTVSGNTANAGGVSASSLYNPTAVAGDGTRLAIVDRFNHRIVMYPTVPTMNGAPGTLFIGQADAVAHRLNQGSPTSSSSLYAPNAISMLGSRLGITDGAERALIWDAPPLSRLDLPKVVLGQPNFASEGQFGGTTSATSMCAPSGLHSDGTRLFVGEGCARRVTVWNTLPTTNQQPASFALGQPDLVTSTINTGGVSGSSMFGRQAPFGDGTRVFTTDTGNNRVLIWNTIPSTNAKKADAVLGQPDLMANVDNNGGISATSLLRPTFVYVSGTKLFVADTANNRVLIWNAVPTMNQTAADVVLGQPNMTSAVAATTASAKTLLGPNTIHVDASGRLYVSDAGNHRILYWNAIPTQNETPADGVIGQPGFDGVLANNGGISARTLQTPSAILASGTALYVLDSGNDRMLLMPRP